MEQVIADKIFLPIRVLAWILSLPIRGISWVVEEYRVRSYDPEKITCPGCGFKGDSGTNNKSCSILFVLVPDPHKAMIEHTCFRCYAKFYSGTFRKAVEWVGQRSLQDKKSDLVSRTIL